MGCELASLVFEGERGLEISAFGLGVQRGVRRAGYKRWGCMAG